MCVLEHLVERDAEDVGDLERDLERRRVLVQLDRVDRLPRHADLVGELLLRHLLVVEAQPADVVDDGFRHQASRRWRTIWTANRVSVAMMMAPIMACTIVNLFVPRMCIVAMDAHAPIIST